MDIVNYLNKKMAKRKQISNLKKAYKNLIKLPEIDNMINNMPTKLTQLEKAYYIYLELGKLIIEDTKFVFGDWKTKNETYYDDIDKEFIGICKSISELYVAILSDERIGINAEIVRQNPDRKISHVDTILNIYGKKYLVNLIIDLSNIKFYRRTKGFGINLYEEIDHPLLQTENELYLNLLEQTYGELEVIDRKDLQKMDKKLNYSFYLPGLSDADSRGIYADDTIEIVKHELRNPEKFKEYILKGKEVPKEDYFKYKLDFIFENKNRFAETTGNNGYLENIRYYNKLFRNFLSEEEYSKIQTYAAVVNDDLRNIISIIKVKQGKNNLYYFYNQEEDKYEEKNSKQMKSIIEKLDKSSLKIVGNLDRMGEEELEELEL